MKESPRSFVLLEQPVVRFFQLYTSLFVRVNAGSILPPGFIGFQAGRLHLSLLDQRLSAANIDAAPDAAAFARCETNCVADVVDTLADAIYPTETEGLID